MVCVLQFVVVLLDRSTHHNNTCISKFVALGGYQLSARKRYRLADTACMSGLSEHRHASNGLTWPVITYYIVLYYKLHNEHEQASLHVGRFPLLSHRTQYNDRFLPRLPALRVPGVSSSTLLSLSAPFLRLSDLKSKE